MQKPDIKDLLNRYNAGTCTEEERVWVESWYLNWEEKSLELSEQELLEDLAAIKSALPKKQGISKSFPRIAAAAAILLTLSASIYFVINNKSSILEQPLAETPVKIKPGRNQALLTLSDGTTVSLDSVKSLASIDQQGVKVSKTADGKLVYLSAATGKAVDAYNTISTPNGGRYDITLPDGTAVTLNAASKIRFPISFSGTDRKVELEGEAYFEVKKDPGKPFLVVSGKQTVQVLGTHFNVNSYADEPQIRTTLLEGSIMLRGATQVILKPGEQARASHQADNFKVVNVDVQTEVAWKDNMFFFENEPIKNCMRQIARWYDVEIVYEDNVSEKKIWGSVNRFSEISKVLKTLELTGNIHFKVEGRRIIVMK